MKLRWVRTFAKGDDYIEDLGGISWHVAGLPRWLHICTAQTRGQLGWDYVERCACGAIRESPQGRWMRRNDTRRAGHRTRPRRDPATQDAALRQLVALGEEIGPGGEPQPMVCLDHMCFLPCHHEDHCASSGIRPCCNVSGDPADVQRVQAHRRGG